MQKQQTNTTEAREKLNEMLADALMKLYTTAPEKFAAAIDYADSIMKGGEDA